MQAIQEVGEHGNDSDMNKNDHFDLHAIPDNAIVDVRNSWALLASYFS